MYSDGPIYDCKCDQVLHVQTLDQMGHFHISLDKMGQDQMELDKVGTQQIGSYRAN